MNTKHFAIGAVLIAGPMMTIAQPSYAVPASIQLTDTWAEGTPLHVTGSLPTLTTSAPGNSNFGGTTQHPVSNPFTQTLTLNTAASQILFVAEPPGSGSADIPITFTLSDGIGGSVTFTDYINYFADSPSDFDDMAWSATSVSSPGKLTSAAALVQTETLSDGLHVQITLPYETDWNMAQQITFDYTGGGGGGGGGTVPEPSPLAAMGMGLIGLMLLRRRKAA